MTQPANSYLVKGYSLPELAQLYLISDRTFKRWIAPFESEIGQRQGRFYNFRQVQVIFDRLGTPDISAPSSSEKKKELNKTSKNKSL